MKILYLNPTGELGGAERSLLFLMASMRAAKPDWQIQLIAGSDGPLIHRATELGVDASAMEFPRRSRAWRRRRGRTGRPAGKSLAAGRWRRARRRPQRRLFASTAARGCALRTGPHPQQRFQDALLSAWACPAGCPLIWHIRDYAERTATDVAADPANAHRCTAAVANSTSVAQDLRTVCGDKLRIHRVHNGVDLRAFSPHGSVANLDEMSAMPVAPPDTIRVGMLATMARWKGHQVFLQAVANASRVTPLRAYVIGAPV